MPRRRKELRDYPSIFWDILQRFKAGEAMVQLQLKDSNAARAVAHDWNRFKQSMNREEHPDFELAYDIMARPDNRAKAGLVEFSPKGLFNYARELKGLPAVDGSGKLLPENVDADGLPKFDEPPMTQEQAEEFARRMNQPTKDPGEEMIQQWLKNKDETDEK